VGILVSAAGFLLLGYAFYDVLHTTLVLKGGGPLTARLAELTWKGALRLGFLRRSHEALSMIGVVIIVEVLTAWVILVWAGWFLVFLGGDPSIIVAGTEQHAGTADVLYYAGYTITTLGVGDFVAAGQPWRLLTALASASGFMLFSLAIAYLLPTVSAAAETRQLAEYISALGRTGEEIVINAWNGRDFLALEPHLVALTPMVSLLSQHYLAYPAMHYFHSSDADTSAPVSIAALDEALTLLDIAVGDEARPPRIDLLPLRKAITELLEHLNVGYVRAGQEPPAPGLAGLGRAGIPLAPSSKYLRDLAGLAGRRRLLMAWVTIDGWTWDLLERPLMGLTPSAVKRAS
jgi:hypothetical protein